MGFIKCSLEPSKVHLQGCICLLVSSQKVTTQSCHKVEFKVCHMWDKEPASWCGRSSPALHDRHGDFCVFLCIDSTVCMCNLLSLARPQKAAIHLKDKSLDLDFVQNARAEESFIWMSLQSLKAYNPFSTDLSPTVTKLKILISTFWTVVMQY